MLKKEPVCDATMRVCFSFPSFCAKSIALVGEFNAWNPYATPLHSYEQGWRVDLVLPMGCAYRYRYFVDGERWFNDWYADFYAPNPYGGDDSVVVTLLPYEMQHIEIICPYDHQPCSYALCVVRKGGMQEGLGNREKRFTL